MIINYHPYIFFIYIYCHPRTDCFILSELFSVARHVGRSKPGPKPTQLYVRQSLRLLGQQAYNVEFLRYYVATAAAAAASVCLHFYTLSATRVLNSFEELCIMPAAAEYYLTVFDELPLVTSPFWSHDKLNRGFRSFTNRTLEEQAWWFAHHQWVHSVSLPYFPNLRRVSGFHLFAVWIFLFVPWTLVTLVLPGTGNEFPTYS